MDEFVTQQGGRRNETDPCVYVFSGKKKRVILIIYVDDIVLASKDLEELNIVKQKLKSEFEIQDLGQITDFGNSHRKGGSNQLHQTLSRKICERSLGKIQYEFSQKCID